MGENRGFLGIILFFLLSAVPLAIWISMMPLSERFANPNSIFTSLGQILGLLGMVMFSLNIIIETKLKFIQDIFGGLGGLHKKHHNLGTITFILILFHPLMLALRLASSSIKQAALFLIPRQYFQINAGIFALVIMEIVLVITFFGKLKYPVWKTNHDILGIAFFLAAVHVFFISSDVSRSMPLRYYLISLIALGLLAFVYRTVLNLREFFAKRKNTISV